LHWLKAMAVMASVSAWPGMNLCVFVSTWKSTSWWPATYATVVSST